MKLSTSYALMEKLHVSTKMSKFDPCAPPAFYTWCVCTVTSRCYTVGYILSAWFPVQGDVTVNQSKVVESNHLYALRKHFCPDVSCIVQDCSASIHSRTGLTKLTTSVTFWSNVYESTYHHPTPSIFIVRFSFIITTETQKSFSTCSFGDSFMKTHHISKL